MHALPDREVQSKISRRNGAQMLSPQHGISAYWGTLGRAFRNPVLGRAADSFDRTAWLAGSLSPLGPFRREKFALCGGDAAKMPANGGLFQCVLRVSGFSGRAHGRFRTSVSAAKNPLPGAEKVWWRGLRLEAVAAGSVLRLKSGNVKTWNQGWASCSHIALAKVEHQPVDAAERRKERSFSP